MAYHMYVKFSMEPIYNIKQKKNADIDYKHITLYRGSLEYCLYMTYIAMHC